MIIRPITKTPNIKQVNLQSKQTQNKIQEQDSFMTQEKINKDILVNRKIIAPNEDVSAFFDSISAQIFPDSNLSHSFSNLLKGGYIALSTSAYADLKDPKSAVALNLDETKSTAKHLAQLEEYIKDGVGVGINFSRFKNPIEEIKKINEYFKYREPSLIRPPAGIALLNITHPKIMDFITLKDNANYKDWCFNISVVMDENFLLKVDNNQDLILDDGTKLDAKRVYQKLLDSMLKKGEPGIVFSKSQNYLCDCCNATQLEENEGLNLAQINLSKFYNPKTKTFDYAFLSQSANVLAIALKRIAPNGYISILGYQDLLDKMELKYGSIEALEVLEKSLLTIKEQVSINNVKMCISPSGATSRILKTTPSIEPKLNCGITYWDEIETLATAQKYLEGGISKTINLNKTHSIQDVDLIIRACAERGIKGITVFPAQ